MTLDEFEDSVAKVVDWIQVLASAIIVVVVLGVLVYAFISAVMPQKVAAVPHAPTVKHTKFCPHRTVQGLSLSC